MLKRMFLIVATVLMCVCVSGADTVKKEIKTEKHHHKGCVDKHVTKDITVTKTKHCDCCKCNYYKSQCYKCQKHVYVGCEKACKCKCQCHVHKCVKHVSVCKPCPPPPVRVCKYEVICKCEKVCKCEKGRRYLLGHLFGHKYCVEEKPTCHDCKPTKTPMVPTPATK